MCITGPYLLGARQELIPPELNMHKTHVLDCAFVLLLVDACPLSTNQAPLRRGVEVASLPSQPPYPLELTMITS